MASTRRPRGAAVSGGPVVPEAAGGAGAPGAVEVEKVVEAAIPEEVPRPGRREGRIQWWRAVLPQR